MQHEGTAYIVLGVVYFLNICYVLWTVGKGEVPETKECDLKLFCMYCLCVSVICIAIEID